MNVKQLLRVEWDAIAGIVAAVLAVVLELLHVAHPGLLLAVTVAILAVILFRDLRREPREERLHATAQRTAEILARYQAALSLPEAVLIGPGRLRAESERFAREAQGAVTYFNVCLLMFRPQSLFDRLLRPAIENPQVGSILFILDESEREHWAREVAPKVARCAGAQKVLDPRWCTLRETVSFILAETRPEGRREVLLSFWGEPFMSRAVEQQVPRYIFRVLGHSDLVARLAEMERQYRLGAGLS